MNFQVRKQSDRGVIESPKHLSELVKVFSSYNLERLSECGRCSRFMSVGLPVPPEGSLESSYMFVGRDPGEQEVEFGRPFYHKAPGGRLFDQMLEVLGLGRDQIYITNALFCRATGNAAPMPEQYMACSYYKVREWLRLPNVKFIFPMGNDAIRLFLGALHPSILHSFGSVYDTNLFKKRVYIIPLYHPGHIVRRRKLMNETVDFLLWVKELVLGIY